MTSHSKLNLPKYRYLTITYSILSRLKETFWIIPSSLPPFLPHDQYAREVVVCCENAVSYLACFFVLACLLRWWVGWSVGWLVDWLVVCLPTCSLTRSLACLLGWLVGCLLGCLVACLVDLRDSRGSTYLLWLGFCLACLICSASLLAC